MVPPLLIAVAAVQLVTVGVVESSDVYTLDVLLVSVFVPSFMKLPEVIVSIVKVLPSVPANAMVSVAVDVPPLYVMPDIVTVPTPP